MGYDGSGGYDRQRNFSGDASANIKILASAMDQELDDFASAMTIPILRDGQNEPSANLPMGGNRHVNVGAAASASDYLRAREFITHTPIFVTDEGAGNTNVSVSVPFYVTASAGHNPADGSQLRIRMANDKTVSAPAIVMKTPQGTHSADIVDFQGLQLGKGVLVSGGIYDFVYSSTQSAWQISNPSPNITTLTSVHLKGRNAAGTITGVTSGLNTQNFLAKHGDLLALHLGANLSVSVSVSTNRLFLSTLPDAWDKSGNGSHLTLVDETNASAHQFRAIMGGSVEFVPIQSAVTVISADTVWKIPNVTIFWIPVN